MGLPLWRGRRGTPDGEAIRGGVHGAASRASERIMRKDSRPLFVIAQRRECSLQRPVSHVRHANLETILLIQ